MNKQAWIDKALEKGMDGFEITRSYSRGREVTWFEGKMDTFVTSRLVSTAFRALVDDKIVSTALEKVDDADMDRVLDELLSAAQVVSESEKDELIGVMDTEEVKSPRVFKEPDAAKIQQLLKSLEEKLSACDPRVTMVNDLGFSSSSSRSELTNSKGVNVQDAVTVQVVVASITMQEDGDLRDGYEMELVEDIDTFDQDAFVEKLKNKVAAQLNAKSMKSTTCPVILNSDAMSTLFGGFASMFSGTLIARGVSPLTGKLGERIFSDKITVLDNPRNVDALYVQNYDDEGHPTYEKTVVRDGVFETILHNTRSAIKMGAQSTGNGFKAGAGSTSASAMNLWIVPGQDDFDTLVKTMDNGVVITELAGMHAGVDFITTNFSLQAKGYLVEHGEKVRPLTLITIAGNFLDLMKKAKAVGNDLEWKLRSVAAPSILFEEAAIGGNE